MDQGISAKGLVLNEASGVFRKLVKNLLEERETRNLLWYVTWYAVAKVHDGPYTYAEKSAMMGRIAFLKRRAARRAVTLELPVDPLELLVR